MFRKSLAWLGPARRKVGLQLAAATLAGGVGGAALMSQFGAEPGGPAQTNDQPAAAASQKPQQKPLTAEQKREWAGYEWTISEVLNGVATNEPSFLTEAAMARSIREQKIAQQPSATVSVTDLEFNYFSALESWQSQLPPQLRTSFAHVIPRISEVTYYSAADIAKDSSLNGLEGKAKTVKATIGMPGSNVTVPMTLTGARIQEWSQYPGRTVTGDYQLRVDQSLGQLAGGVTKLRQQLGTAAPGIRPANLELPSNVYLQPPSGTDPVHLDQYQINEILENATGYLTELSEDGDPSLHSTALAQVLVGAKQDELGRDIRSEYFEGDVAAGFHRELREAERNNPKLRERLAAAAKGRIVIGTTPNETGQITVTVGNAVLSMKQSGYLEVPTKDGKSQVDKDGDTIYKQSDSRYWMVDSSPREVFGSLAPEKTGPGVVFASYQPSATVVPGASTSLHRPSSNDGVPVTAVNRTPEPTRRITVVKAA